MSSSLYPIRPSIIAPTQSASEATIAKAAPPAVAPASEGSCSSSHGSIAPVIRMADSMRRRTLMGSDSRVSKRAVDRFGLDPNPGLSAEEKVAKRTAAQEALECTIAEGMGSLEERPGLIQQFVTEKKSDGDVELAAEAFILAGVDLAAKTQHTPKHGYTAVAASSQKTIKFPDIFPWDHNRVVTAGYVNASCVQAAGREHIACEAPLPQDFHAFWSMVWENSNLIVNLTELTEKSGSGRTIIKAHCYWPNTGESGDVSTASQTSPAIGVLCTQQQTISIEEDFDQSACDRQRKPYIIKREFLLTRGDEVKTVTMLHYRYLMDMQAPQPGHETGTFLRLLEEVRTLEAGAPESKTIVHCSAGVGRTGMFFSSADFHHRLTLGGEQINDPDLAVALSIARLRGMRPSMVQTAAQVKLIKWVIETYSINAQKV